MASGRTNEEIGLYTAQVIQELEDYLNSLVKHGEPKDKRADKIDQWIESWSKYLKREQEFNPRSLPLFKRGSVIVVDLGFNVGSEYGGIHYAIVLNKRDSRRNHLLHILPLTSIKEKTDLEKLKYYQLSLSDEIHRLLIQKAIKGLQIIDEKRNSCISEIHLLNNKLSEIESLANEQQKDPDTNPKLESYLKTEISNVKSKLEELEKIVNQITSQSIYIEKLVEKISKLKKGSIALLNQVTTISKLRILDPINQRSFFNDIVLSTETLDIIDAALKNIL